MIGLILNSGLGSRLGEFTADKPKCLVELADGQTILARQIRLLAANGISTFVITTGPYIDPIVDAARAAVPEATFSFVNNPDYSTTNYIYSVYLARHLLYDQDVVSLHGDLVFAPAAATRLVSSPRSCVAIDSTLPPPEKDFKATLSAEGLVERIGVDVWDQPLVTLQPFYHLNISEWNAWLEEIARFCETNRRTVYAENAFNAISSSVAVYPEDLQGIVCQEVDTPEDLERINLYLDKELS